MRFSRTSLNGLILGCIAIIAWISINEGNREKEPIIDVPALPQWQFEHWLSDEGVLSTWQYVEGDFRIRVMLQEAQQLKPISLEFSQPAGTALDQVILNLQPWLMSLKLEPSNHNPRYGGISLQGTMPNNIARLISAKIINELTLSGRITPIAQGLGSCPWQPVSAALWLQQQMPLGQEFLPNVSTKSWDFSITAQLPESPSAKNLNNWKQNYLSTTLAHYQDQGNQFDILSQLAYYRLPSSYLDQGYLRINELTTESLALYLSQCTAKADDSSLDKVVQQ